MTLLERFFVKRDNVYHRVLPYLNKVEGRIVTLAEIKSANKDNDILTKESLSALADIRLYATVLKWIKANVPEGKRLEIDSPKYNTIFRLQDLFWLIDNITVSLDKQTITVNYKDYEGSWINETNTYHGIKLV
jgi:hypothetical protein